MTTFIGTLPTTRPTISISITRSDVQSIAGALTDRTGVWPTEKAHLTERLTSVKSAYLVVVLDAEAGDLSNISKATPMTFGPSRVFAGKREGKRGSSSRTSSSSNMFSVLSQSAGAGADVAKGVPEAPAQRRGLILAPRSKPVTKKQGAAAPKSESEGEDEIRTEPEMTEEQAKKKIDEDAKEFFAVRSLDEAEVYFTNLPAIFHSKLVDRFASAAVELKEPDAQLVADFFARAAARENCTAGAFEEGLMPIAEIIDDIVIDAPKAPNYFALMVKGAGLDEERRARLASNSMDSEQLLALLS